MFKTAGPAEILRSQQKDDHLITSLRSLIAESFQLVAGARRWIKWRKELDVLSDVGYFLLTTLSGYQTIGEEYVNIIQVDSTKRSLPSFTRRLVMVLVHACSPYILQRSLKNLEKSLEQSQHQSEEIRYLLQMLPVARQCLLYLHRLHLGLFYLHGVFYHLAKRLTGVYYIKYMANQSTSADISNSIFKYLAALSLGQLSLSVILEIYKIYHNRQNTSNIARKSDSESTVSRKCALCLERMKAATLSPCGHLFCWYCIHSWCQTKSECPLCRDQFEPHRLVLLQNV